MILKEYLHGVNVCVCYLEAVLDVVARLADAHSLQHTCVSQLPQHQVIIKPQGQLRKRKKKVIEERKGKMTEKEKCQAAEVTEEQRGK